MNLRLPSFINKKIPYIDAFNQVKCFSKDERSHISLILLDTLIKRKLLSVKV